MKRLLTKFRMWLINKLVGGKMFPQTVLIEARVVLEWDYIVKLRPTWLEHHVKKQLAEQMIEKILEDEALYTVERKHTIGVPAEEYRMRMCIVCDRKGGAEQWEITRL